MAASALKLESFLSAKIKPAPEPTFTQADLDRERSEGYAAGVEQGRIDDVIQLCAGLEHMARTLAEDAGARANIRKEAVAGLIPLLTGIVDALAPLNASPLIAQALTSELSQLADNAEPVSVRIGCNHQFRPMVEECLAASGIVGVEFDDTASDRISLSFAGGVVKFSNEKIIDDIRCLIREIEEDSKNG